MTTKQELIVLGLKLVAKELSHSVHTAVMNTDNAVKKDCYIFRNGDDLADAAEQHAYRILEAVQKYRDAAGVLAELNEQGGKQ